MDVLTKKQIPKAATLLNVAFLDNPMFQYLFPNQLKRPKILQPLFECIIQILMDKGIVYISSQNLEGMLALIKEESGSKTKTATVLKCVTKCIRCLPHISITDVYRRYKKTDFEFEGEKKIFRNLKEYYSIQAVAVDPKHRGKGVMSTMIRNVLAHVQAENSVCLLETETLENVEMYRHFGFVVIGKMTYVPSVWVQYILLYDPNELHLPKGRSAYDEAMFGNSSVA